MNDKSKRTFTVVLRGSSAAIFAPKDRLRIEAFPSAVGRVNITYSTRWLRKGNSILVPGNLWIEIKGKGTSLNDIMVPFANAGLALLPMISLSANAATMHPEIELGFDSSPDVKEREYFQQFIPSESEVISFARRLKVKETISFLDALDRSKDGERLRRAINQYKLALEFWRLGQEALSLAHLWMALEALTKARIRYECRKRGINTERDLANILGVELKDLDPTMRRDMILKGDEDCYRKSKEASDGLEHGFLGFDKIHNLARDTRFRMAQYIRTEILEQLDLDENTFRSLTNDEYGKPMGHWPVIKYVRGKLLGDNQELAAEGNAYPFLKWKTVLDKCEVEEDGGVHIQFKENLTAELGPGITFKPISYETWRPQ